MASLSELEGGVISKRIRALKKKLRRINQIETEMKTMKVKTLNDDQKKLVDSKPVVEIIINELQNLHSLLAPDVQEEDSVALSKSSINSEPVKECTNDDQRCKTKIEIGMEKTMIVVQMIWLKEQVCHYYILDLEADKMMTAPFTTLSNPLATTTFVTGSSLYILGGGFLEDMDDKDLISHYHLHLGASYLDLNTPHLRSLLFEEKQLGNIKWKFFPGTQHPRIRPKCVSLDGRIYVLGGSSESFGEVFTPSVGVWEPLDAPHTDLFRSWEYVSYRVYSDEKKQRLLVHCLRSLFAYYPSRGEWDCLTDDLQRCDCKPSVFADDVLYFYTSKFSDRIAAFDLSTEAWLTVEYYSKFTQDIRHENIEDMLYLGNGIMCLVFRRDRDVITPSASIKIELNFVLFRVERIPTSVLRVTPLDVKCFLFEGDMMIPRRCMPL